MNNDQLIMVIDGTPHRGWTRASIGRSIERGPHQFDLTLTDNWSGRSTVSPRSVRAGMPVQAYINDDLVLSGYIDDVDPQYDKENHTLRARGRSKLGDLVDCSTEGRTFDSQSLLQICTALCQPFGISVSVDSSAKDAANQVFKGKQYTLDLGEAIWDFLEELARIRAVLLTSDSNGNLVITRAGIGRADIALELGKNIEMASGTFSSRELFSDYIVTAQQPSTPQLQLEGVDNSQPKARVKAGGRFRPLVISNDNPGDIAACQMRAEWQRNVHEGRAAGVVYTVTGWRQTPGGRLWAPNELIHVNDDWMGWNDERLIVETRINLDAETGSNTEIRVMPKGAFAVEREVKAEHQLGAWF